MNLSVQRIRDDDSGFSLVEVMIASVMLIVGLVSLAYCYAMGLNVVLRAQEDSVARQKAREAMEDVFTARDTSSITFDQICNIGSGASCIFTAAPTALTTAGADEIVNTADDGPVETVDMPGPDGIIGTADDLQVPLLQYQRQIQITKLSDVLKLVTVTITYTTSQGMPGSVSITALMSPYV